MRQRLLVNGRLATSLLREPRACFVKCYVVVLRLINCHQILVGQAALPSCLTDRCMLRVKDTAFIVRDVGCLFKQVRIVLLHTLQLRQVD